MNTTKANTKPAPATPSTAYGTATTEGAMWGIHAGRTGDAEKLFLDHGLIALGWPKLGDLGSLTPDREAFKKAVEKAYPEKKPGAIPNNAGQLYRFVHEIKQDDLVVYPAKSTHQIHIGRVTGGYTFDPKDEAAYPNRRKVKWLKAVPRMQFTQGALYEIGSAMSLFQVKNFSEEFRAAVSGKAGPPVTVDADATVAAVAGEIEVSTRDFVLKRLSQDLKGHPFAEFVGHLLECMGYNVRVSPAGVDGGIDIVAHRDRLGFEPPIIKVQVKSSDSPIGAPEVQQLFGLVGEREFGLFVALGGFKNPAREFAKSRSNLRLINGDEVVQLLLEHYENFDPRYKGLIPLRRVYVPVALDVGSEDEL